MTTQEFITQLEANYAKNVAISRAKNSDYAGSDDAFLNFRLIEKLTNGRISAADGIIVRLSDKLQRTSNLLSREAQVADEKVGDTLADLANYAMILKILLEDK